ncbi:transposase [Actinokineospora auranticolor]|uniref:transposase family protein n=1 Tax=Actinokineospora auranticolor TaxID=155976 RepID=UPI0015E39B95|nr:transposase family protein [Actinokineospora auranticolor]
MVTLAYLRRNRVQAELAEAFEVSQSTISRATAAVTPLLAGVLEQCVPTADDLDDRSSHIVDGTLLPCWSWASRPESFSGKHRTTGLTVQVVRTLDRRLRWVSDPLPGSRDDIVGLKASPVLDGRDPSIRLGDNSPSIPGRPTTDKLEQGCPPRGGRGLCWIWAGWSTAVRGRIRWAERRSSGGEGTDSLGEIGWVFAGEHVARARVADEFGAG